MSPIASEIVPEPLPFIEAIDYFRERVPMSTGEFFALEEEARARAFTIAYAQKAGLVAGVKGSLQKALDEGISFGQWQQDANALYDRLGVTRMNPFHLDVVYRQNIQQSYMAGRYKQMTRPEVLKRRPYWEYIAVRDTHSRPSHARQHGNVYPADHPYWHTWYPTNGFRCRCGVRSLSAAEVEKRGLRVREKMPLDVPDEGFEANHAAGFYGDLVRETIESDLGTFGPVFSGGLARYGRPGKIPPTTLLIAPEELPLSQELRRRMTAEQVNEFYREAYRKEMGIPAGLEFTEVKDVLGESVNFNMGGLEYLIGKGDGRERFIPFLKPTIQDPYEVWLVETKSSTGKIRYRKRYIAGFEGRDGAHLVVVDQFSQNQWGIWNAYPLEPRRVNGERNGVLLYGK